MIYTAVKNYERALYFFEVAITTPALAMSHIMLESYKKYILVSLILHGTVRWNHYDFDITLHIFALPHRSSHFLNLIHHQLYPDLWNHWVMYIMN